MDDPRSTGDRSKRSTFFPSLLSGHCPLTIPQVTYRLLRIYVCTRPSKYAQHLVYDLFETTAIKILLFLYFTLFVLFNPLPTRKNYFLLICPPNNVSYPVKWYESFSTLSSNETETRVITALHSEFAAKRSACLFQRLSRLEGPPREKKKRKEESQKKSVRENKYAISVQGHVEGEIEHGERGSRRPRQVSRKRPPFNRQLVSGKGDQRGVTRAAG